MRPIPLPEPDADARAHSTRVLTAIRAAITAGGGFLPFRDYMQIAMYAPGLGYYVAGTRKFGAGGDFVTGPELTSLFGHALAVDVAATLAATNEREIVELGAGSGRLAADLLAALDAAGAAPSRYRIVEVSPELRDRQRASVRDDPRVEWLTALPPAINGAIVMNEVLDAIAPDVVVRRAGAWFERGVAWRDGALGWAERPLTDALLRARAEARFPPGVDYASEINPAAEALVEHLGRRLASGALLAIDYGFPRHEYYHPQRAAGTLIAHYRHRSTSDPFLWPGLADLTAHVDFTAVAEAGERAGLVVEGFTAQAAFLLASGILDGLAAVGDPTTTAYLREAAAVQMLTSPAEMGELFKVIALARTPGIAWRGFSLVDVAHRL